MKNKRELIIDARNKEMTKISLVIDGKKHEKNISIVVAHSEVILPTIEALLREWKMDVSGITSISVPVDKGSFTGRRVALAIGIMLGKLLSVQVNGHDAHYVPDIPYEADKWK